MSNRLTTLSIFDNRALILKQQTVRMISNISISSCHVLFVLLVWFSFMQSK